VGGLAVLRHASNTYGKELVQTQPERAARLVLCFDYGETKAASVDSFDELAPAIGKRTAIRGAASERLSVIAFSVSRTIWRV
jgi:hypothetical protein